MDKWYKVQGKSRDSFILESTMSVCNTLGSQEHDTFPLEGPSEQLHAAVSSSDPLTGPTNDLSPAKELRMFEECAHIKQRPGSLPQDISRWNPGLRGVGHVLGPGPSVPRHISSGRHFPHLGPWSHQVLHIASGRNRLSFMPFQGTYRFHPHTVRRGQGYTWNRYLGYGDLL